MTPHPIEPELNHPAPRPVGYREGFKAGCGLWAGRLVLLPHSLCGVLLLIAALSATVQYVRVWAFGTEYEGHVVRKVESRGGKGGMSRTVDFAYTVNGVEHTGRTSMSAEAFADVAEGDPMTVRALESDPAAGAWVRLPGRSASWEPLGMWAAALFWNGIMSIFLWGAYVRPWRDRRLVRLGRPLTAVIRAVTERGTRPRSYRVTYEFTVPDRFGLAGTRQTGSMTTERREALEYTAGRKLTILYDPDKPKRSVIYRLTDYRAK